MHVVFMMPGHPFFLGYIFRDDHDFQDCRLLRFFENSHRNGEIILKK